MLDQLINQNKNNSTSTITSDPKVVSSTKEDQSTTEENSEAHPDDEWLDDERVRKPKGKKLKKFPFRI